MKKGKQEIYPEIFDDLSHVFSWMKRKTGDLLQGRKYVFTTQDFLDLAQSIRYSNWMAARFGDKKWYKMSINAAFGPVKNPKIQSRIIPLNAPVNKSKNAILPYKLIDDFIDSAGFIIILDMCLCRKGMECKDYPIDFGCLMLGEGARVMLKNGHGREATAKEAKAHVRKAAKHGLVPFAAHAKIEEQAMGIPVALRNNFIEICLCCPCCCLAMKNIKYYPAEIHKHNFINVGFVAKAQPGCKGCNKCVDICPADAIKVNGNKVWVQEDICIGCGVCQNVCKHDAISLVQIGKAKGELLDYFDGRLHLDMS